jgi:hypothetical protein
MFVVDVDSGGEDIFGTTSADAETLRLVTVAVAVDISWRVRERLCA